MPPSTPHTHHAGGAAVLFDRLTQQSFTVPIPIPIYLDSSYQAELFTAWQVLCALTAPSSTLLLPPYRQGLRHFADSKSILTALTAMPTDDSSLSSYLLQQCRDLLHTLGDYQPSHLYSHRDETFLDRLLALADTSANETRRAHPPVAAWSPQLHTPPYLLCKAGIPYHIPPAQLAHSPGTGARSPANRLSHPLIRGCPTATLPTPATSLGKTTFSWSHFGSKHGFPAASLAPSPSTAPTPIILYGLVT